MEVPFFSIFLPVLVPLEAHKFVVRVGDVQELIPFHQYTQTVFVHGYYTTTFQSAIAVYVDMVFAFLVRGQSSRICI